MHQVHVLYQSTEYVRCLMKKAALVQVYGAPILNRLSTVISTRSRMCSSRDGSRWHAVGIGRNPRFNNIRTWIVADHTLRRTFQSVGFITAPPKNMFSSSPLSSSSFGSCTMGVIATTPRGRGRTSGNTRTKANKLPSCRHFMRGGGGQGEPIRTIPTSKVAKRSKIFATTTQDRVRNSRCAGGCINAYVLRPPSSPLFSGCITGIRETSSLAFAAGGIMPKLSRYP